MVKHSQKGDEAMTTPAAKAVEDASRTILNREQEERLERAREQAREEIERKEWLRQRDASIASAQKKLQAMNRESLAQARANAAAALDAFVSEIDQWNAELRDVYEAVAPYAGPESGISASPSGSLSVQGVEVSSEGPQGAVAALAVETLRAHISHGFISLDYPPD